MFILQMNKLRSRDIAGRGLSTPTLPDLKTQALNTGLKPVVHRDEVITAKNICNRPGIALSTLQELSHLFSQ